MPKRILIADDSVTIQKAFAMVFGGQDLNLVAAKSLDEALGSARQTKPDLIIADASLASRTGYDLCTAIKADAQLRGVPVYILASSHVPYDETKGRVAGADGHLLKPFDSQQIIDKVTQILASPVGAPAVAPAADDVTAKVSVDAPGSDFDDSEDSYGEFTIEVSTSAPAPAPVRAPPQAAPLPPRPPAVPAAVSRPAVPAPPVAAPRPILTPASNPLNRTMMGMPVSGVAPSAAAGAPAAALRPQPSAPLPSLAAATLSAVDKKMATLASKGPEYEVLAKLSREVIERIVWEIVPDLAEVIIRQEVDRLANAKK